MAEHGRIARHFAPLTLREPGSFALTDDAALLTPPAGCRLVITTDSVISGIHVLPNASAEQIACKLVRRNLSDLAAMGATPWRCFLNLHTPHAMDDAWFTRFTATLAHEQEQFGMVLAGGDSTSGGNHVHATMTCIGHVAGSALLRSTAAVGDDVYVSGTIGDAALGLRVLQQQLAADSASSAFLTQRYHTPQPRLALGEALHGIASACMDISDGLLADAAQLARASGVQIQLTRNAVPLSPAAAALVLQNTALWPTILGGGDDYELLFTAPTSQRETIARLHVDVMLTRIGTVVEGDALLLDGVAAQGGWEHA